MNPVPSPDPSIIPDSYHQAWQRLIGGAVPQDELVSLIETIFSSEKVTEMVDRLQGGDVQTFIDALATALDNPDLVPLTQRKYMKLLRRMCTRHTLVPKSLKIESCDNAPGVPMYCGGFGDVSKREHLGRAVAVKVLRTYATSDLQETFRKFCREFVPWKALRHPNVLPLLGVIMTETKFAMVFDWMPNGSINEFVEARQDANRFELLADVARGLTYVHGRGMVHGDLKGANILVDQSCHALLADFGLATIISESTTSNSFTEGGFFQWMSPELFDPEIQVHRRTKHSDCYALGMVIYEVLRGRKPFYQYTDPVVVMKVSRGGRPEGPRVEGVVWFTDDVWRILELCWTHQPGMRLSSQNVFQYLEKVSGTWTPPPSLMAGPSKEVNSPTWSIYDIASEPSLDADEREVSSPSRSSDKLPPNGDADDNSIHPSTHGFSPSELTGHQDLGTDVEDLGGFASLIALPACEEDLPRLRSPQLFPLSLDTHNPDEWEEHPDFPGAFQMSPVQPSDGKYKGKCEEPQHSDAREQAQASPLPICPDPHIVEKNKELRALRNEIQRHRNLVSRDYFRDDFIWSRIAKSVGKLWSVGLTGPPASGKRYRMVLCEVGTRIEDISRDTLDTPRVALRLLSEM